MSRLVEGVLRNASAGGGSDGWELRFMLRPWRIDGGSPTKDLLCVLFRMKDERAATRAWLAWDKHLDEIVSFAVGPLKPASQYALFKKWTYGRMPIEVSRDEAAAEALVKAAPRPPSKADIPGLGDVTLDADGGAISKLVRLSVLDGHSCAIRIERYLGDAHPRDFERVIRDLLSRPSLLRAAQPHVFRYARDFATDGLKLRGASDVWRHVRLGPELTLARSSARDRNVYASLECSCDWEREHGLQIVLKNGRTVCKVGPFDGHFTNADAYGDRSLRAVYWSTKS